MAHDAGVQGAGFDVPGPAHHGGNPVGPFPIGVLLTAEGGHAGIRPAVHVGAVVGAVHHDGVIGDAQLIEQVEHLADALIVIDHHVVILRLPAPGTADVLGPGVGAEVHVGGVEPHEEGLPRCHGITDEALGLDYELFVAVLHPLLGQRPGIFDPLGAISIGPAVQDTTGAKVLLKVRKVFRVGIIPLLRFFLGIEVIQVAEELIEAVHRRQMLILVAEVVLAELAGAVAEGLEQAGDGRILRPIAERGTRHAHLAEAGAKHVLA